ncbi:MAG: alpha-amylase family glycosyl hydrolase [Candidatus Pseudobacter hemicellulosilyticus]|uniref:Alpha-amylase family glycosyl hydrolase n=1 Tax=Candidatus Pseudobacter hemicellulosilyticus TaxID=3121375 RepID=A0AAJ6BJL8_9BACT|nr:MAG: alpha-amylase family glycosyl hydrolase [Pseudobacter sp.]
MQRRFTPVPWFSHASLYEVNIRQYTPEGTFNAFARHLPRLADMGIQILWFMPVTPISQQGRKGELGSYYACSDYVATNPEFGSLEDFKAMVSQAHALGMKVIIDWVANHTGLDHVWTQTSPGFYKQNADGKFYDTHGWDDVIDLNYYDQPMRQAMIDAMAFWVREAGIDGFRCDMAHLVPRDFWQQARTSLDPLKHLFWLAETEDLHYLEVFDCCYAWRWMHLTEKFIKGDVDTRSLVELLNSYEKEFPYNTCPLFFTSNHDENSWNGTEYEKYGDAAHILAVLSCTWDGLPLIYSGQELPNHKRLKFFDRDPIEWGSGQPALHDFYKALLQLRLRHPALQAGRDANPQWLSTNAGGAALAWVRKAGDRRVITILNCSKDLLLLQLPGVSGLFTNIFDGTVHSLDPETALPLDGWQALVLAD